MKKIWITAAAVVALAGASVLSVRAVLDTTPTPEDVITASPSATPLKPTSVPTPPPYTGPVALAVTATATMKFTPTLEPSDFVNVFQLVDPANGYYATGETTYLITHSYAAGSGAPGNAWEKLTIGQVVSYNGEFYQVDRIATPSKGAISSEPVWFNDPSMLVMITCVSRGPGNPATNNYVITLHRL